jgi:hypothetical protein
MDIIDGRLDRLLIYVHFFPLYYCCNFLTLKIADKKLFRHKPKSIEHAKQQIQAILDKPPYLRLCAEHYHETTDEGTQEFCVCKKHLVKRFKISNTGATTPTTFSQTFTSTNSLSLTFVLTLDMMNEIG